LTQARHVPIMPRERWALGHRGRGGTGDGSYTRRRGAHLRQSEPDAGRRVSVARSGAAAAGRCVGRWLAGLHPGRGESENGELPAFQAATVRPEMLLRYRGMLRQRWEGVLLPAGHHLLPGRGDNNLLPAGLHMLSFWGRNHYLRYARFLRAGRRTSPLRAFLKRRSRERERERERERVGSPYALEGCLAALVA
jgi:hypothetical protein